MKLTDIIAEETVADYVKRLTKTLNIKKLGGGHFSSVFQHPVYHNVAVKLCTKQDPMAVLYLRECAKRPGNPWLPKIISIHKVTFHDADLDPEFISADKHGDAQNYLTHIIFMQKLRPIRMFEYKDALKQILSSLPNEIFKHPEPPYDWRNHRQSELERKKVRMLNNKEGRVLPPLDRIDSFDNLSNYWDEVAKRTSDPHIRELAQLLDKFNASDIHQGNVLMSPGDHPVITDPVAS